MRELRIAPYRQLALDLGEPGGEGRWDMLPEQARLRVLALQYELRRHAAELGWGEQQITVIDEDLARSAATASGRLGFTDLVAAVGLGKVGIIVGREVSRLARNNALFRYRNNVFCSAYGFMPRGNEEFLRRR